MNAEIEAYLQELVQEIAADKGFTVHLFECGEGDHVHCFVSAPPKLSITAIVKYLKGITGRKLFADQEEWFCVCSSQIIHNCDREISERDHRQEIIRTFSGNKRTALERRAVEPFLLCGNGRVCVGRKHPQIY